MTRPQTKPHGEGRAYRSTAVDGRTLPQHGRPPTSPAMPPRWKTAFVVWVAIYPSITLVLWLAGPRMQSWPLAVRTLAITAFVVPLMVYLLLPVLQRLLRPWLRKSGKPAP
jgi:antibiotic biosynthesis monooxygenase (ABM) superfamily enzyme